MVWAREDWGKKVAGKALPLETTVLCGGPGEMRVKRGGGLLAL